MTALVDRWGLQYRITASVGLGLGAILILFGYVTFWSVGQVTAAALLERQQLAVILAQHVETLLAMQGAGGVAPSTMDQLLQANDTGAGGRLRVEVLDGSGTAVIGAGQAPPGPVPPGNTPRVPPPNAHAALLADLIAARQPGVRLHHPTGGATFSPHIVA